MCIVYKWEVCQPSFEEQHQEFSCGAIAMAIRKFPIGVDLGMKSPRS